MIKFILLVNKQGQTRLSQYYDFKDVGTRTIDEAEIIRRCLTRNEKQVHVKQVHVIKNRYM